MDISVTSSGENCNYLNYCVIEESLDSVLNITVQFENHIPTSQSKKAVKDELSKLVEAELSKYHWIIVGPVYIDYVWYLDGVGRQRTDKRGDLDNITKPLQDALSGSKGVIVDDTQAKSIYTCWRHSDSELEGKLVISIRFMNDRCMLKDKLIFVETANGIYDAFECDISNELELEAVNYTINCDPVKIMEEIDLPIPLIMKISEYRFHITRLHGFRNQKEGQTFIYNKKEFNKLLSSKLKGKRKLPTCEKLIKELCEKVKALKK